MKCRIVRSHDEIITHSFEEAFQEYLKGNTVYVLIGDSEIPATLSQCLE